MKVLAALVTAGVLGGHAYAKPAPSARSNYALKEYHPIPEQWTNIGPAPKDVKINLQIGLKQSQFDELERHLYEVSDPDHERYGQHLSGEDVHEFVKPTDEGFELVHEWLREHGVERHHCTYSPAKDWINIPLSLSSVEALLDTEYSVFEHKEDGDRIVRTTDWSLPKHLHEHIDVVAPTNSFFRAEPQVKLRKREMHHKPVLSENGDAQAMPLDFAAGTLTNSDGGVESACNFTAITPTCLRTLYRTLDYEPKVAGMNRIGLANFLKESNNRSDVHLFLRQFRPDAAHAAHDFKVNIVAHGKNQQKPNTAEQNATHRNIEGNLDAETIIGITYPTPLQTYNTGGTPPYIPDKFTPMDTNEPYLAWTKYVLNQTNDELPQVISTSYGDDEQTVPPSYAKRVCNHYAQLGARGVTLLFSSGDSGVGPSGSCISNDGKKTEKFLPSFSSGCPYVTVVGGTMNYPEVVGSDPTTDYSPGGGFSDRWPRPKYQDAAVKKYLKKLGNRYEGLYNRKGRAYPDIAAQSVGYIVTWAGTNILVDGTSAACPTAGSVISLVNDALISAGKSPLGFLNPWLYKHGHKAFNDVKKGSNLGCDTKGFPAMRGWDAASGWGTPDFKKILKLKGISS